MSALITVELLTVTRGVAVMQAFAFRSPTIQTRKPQMHPRLINEYQISRVYRETPQAMGKPQVLDSLRLLFSGNQCFF